jgi:hypothetical protein
VSRARPARTARPKYKRYDDRSGISRAAERDGIERAFFEPQRIGMRIVYKIAGMTLHVASRNGHP